MTSRGTRRWLLVLIGVVLGAVLVSPCPLWVPALVVRETPLGRLPAGFSAGSAVFSPDSARLAYDVWHDANSKSVVVDGVEGPRYSCAGYSVFSPDSRRFAYTAWYEPGKSQAVVDGVEQFRYDDVRDVAFSPDSRHVAYGAKKGDGHVLVIDDLESPAYTGFVDGANVRWNGDASLHAVLLRGEEFVRADVEVTWRWLAWLKRLACWS